MKNIKEGKVLLIGRPNVGKSTFVNNIIGQKVAITSPKPQTTRFAIKALYEEERGKILFVDTPGIFGKAEDKLAKKINKKTMEIIHEEVDVVIYMIDQTRKRDFEEAHVLGLVRKIDKPKILVINKIDDSGTSYLPQYKFLEDEFSNVFEISAINKTNCGPLIDKLFELIPSGGKLDLPEGLVYPIVNIDSKLFISELIREKIFLMMGEEIPYRTMVIVDQVKERDDHLMYIKARILVTEDRYKGMLIGAGGRKIKEIGSYARKDIALAISKKVYLELNVETDPHWQETYYN